MMHCYDWLDVDLASSTRIRSVYAALLGSARAAVAWLGGQICIMARASLFRLCDGTEERVLSCDIPFAFIGR